MGSNLRARASARRVVANSAATSVASSAKRAARLSDAHARADVEVGRRDRPLVQDIMLGPDVSVRPAARKQVRGAVAIGDDQAGHRALGPWPSLLPMSARRPFVAFVCLF